MQIRSSMLHHHLLSAQDAPIFSQESHVALLFSTLSQSFDVLVILPGTFGTC